MKLFAVEWYTGLDSAVLVIWADSDAEALQIAKEREKRTLYGNPHWRVKELQPVKGVAFYSAHFA